METVFWVFFPVSTGKILIILNKLTRASERLLLYFASGVRGVTSGLDKVWPGVMPALMRVVKIILRCPMSLVGTATGALGAES